MTTQQNEPVPPDLAENTRNDRGPDQRDESIDESIDESMAEADRANGEGDPDDAPKAHRNGESRKPKPMRRAD